VGMKKRRKSRGVDVLFGQLKGNLVREKKGRVSAGGGGALCSAAWCGRGLPWVATLFFFKGWCAADWMGLRFCGCPNFL